MDQDTKPKEFSVVIISDGQGKVLFGKRNDNKKWTLAAGGLNPGETPEEGALREMFEETGLRPKKLSFVTTKKTPNNTVHFFSCQCPGEPTTENDPDKECSKLQWVDVRGGVPSNIWNNLHGPKGDENIVRQVYDLKKSEQVWLEDCGFLDLSKSENESEVSTLLRHPNPSERSLALKLNTVTPHDLAVAILDPDPKVWGTAFDHKDATHAHTILSSNTRDAAGNPLWERHNLLLKDPRFNKEHLTLMAHAVRKDSSLSPKDQADRLKVLALNGYSDLKKSSAWAHHLLYAGSTQGQDLADSSAEPVHETLKPLKHEYESALSSEDAIEPHNAGLHDIGQVSHKVVYKVGSNKLMVKPYAEEEQPLSGWSEGASQAIYHAAGLGHLHQRSFVSHHGGGKYNIPATVIHLDAEATPIHKAPLGTVREQNPALDDEARKMSVMDFLTANHDRHTNNLMVQKNGHLLAVDNASAFGSHPYTFPYYTNKGVSVVLGKNHDMLPEGKQAYTRLLADWWPGISTDVKSELNKRVAQIKHPAHSRRIKEAFDQRAAWLDRKSQEAKAGNVSGFDDFAPAPLEKRMEEAEFLGDHPKMKIEGLHENLLDKHPASMNADVEHFEKNVNTSKHNVRPLKEKLKGADMKAVYGHADKKYLVKPSVFNNEELTHLNTPLSAWSELTHQAMYHAGGIGHLHQKVHATVAKNVFPDAHGLVVHMEPGAKEVRELNDKEKTALTNHPDFKKIPFMDFVTFNKDRHEGNLMVKPDGTPLAIDHSLVFGKDADSKFSLENQDLHYEEPGYGFRTPMQTASKPDASTWAWWDANKDKIKESFHKHADLIPHKETRNRLKDSFNYRMDMLEDGATPMGQPIREGLHKTLEGADFLHKQHDQPSLIKPINVAGVHDKLKVSTPDAIKIHRQKFELGLNQHPTVAKPVMSYDPSVKRTLAGEEPKAIYKMGNDHVMVKPQAAPTSRLSAWNEMTSQAMYHAGGIGHLHQKVHATTLANQGGKTVLGKDPHAIVVHMAPNVRPVSEALKDDQDTSLDSMASNPEHLQSLKKIGVMDWLTSNPDRHEGNIMIAPDGSPLAIDHGRAFSSDRVHAFGGEYDRDLEAQGRIALAGHLNHPDMPKATSQIMESVGKQKAWDEAVNKDPHKQLDGFDNFSGYGGGDFFSDATKMGGSPDEETWNWFDANKDKMHEAFRKHANMLPDQDARNKMMGSFNVRMEHLKQVRENSRGKDPNKLDVQNHSPVAYRPTAPSMVESHPTERRVA